MADIKDIKHDIMLIINRAFRDYVATPDNTAEVAEMVGRNNAAGEIHDKVAAYFAALNEPKAATTTTTTLCKCGHAEAAHRVNIGRSTELIFTGCYSCQCERFDAAI